MTIKINADFRKCMMNIWPKYSHWTNSIWDTNIKQILSISWLNDMTAYTTTVTDNNYIHSFICRLLQKLHISLSNVNYSHCFYLDKQLKNCYPFSVLYLITEFLFYFHINMYVILKCVNRIFQICTVAVNFSLISMRKGCDIVPEYAQSQDHTRH